MKSMQTIAQKTATLVSTLLLLIAVLLIGSAYAGPTSMTALLPQSSSVKNAPAGNKAVAQSSRKYYLGFDQNLYPGDAALPTLRRSFAFTGYWLNAPPGMNHSEWIGKRSALKRAGFGFMLLFNGRLYRELHNRDAAALGLQDAREALRLAHEQGFRAPALLFLDEEEGGRMLPEQLAYIGAWLDGVRAGGFRAGVYCSGIEVPDGPGQTISTARDLGDHFPGAPLWVANDATPPSPGCVAKPLPPVKSGVATALVWQFAQSPERRQFTQSSAITYAADGNCYAPGLTHTLRSALDLDTSSSPDPSAGR